MSMNKHAATSHRHGPAPTLAPRRRTTTLPPSQINPGTLVAALSPATVNTTAGDTFSFNASQTTCQLGPCTYSEHRVPPPLPHWARCLQPARQYCAALAPMVFVCLQQRAGACVADLFGQTGVFSGGWRTLPPHPPPSTLQNASLSAAWAIGCDGGQTAAATGMTPSITTGPSGADLSTLRIMAPMLCQVSTCSWAGRHQPVGVLAAVDACYCMHEWQALACVRVEAYPTLAYARVKVKTACHRAGVVCTAWGPQVGHQPSDASPATVPRRR